MADEALDNPAGDGGADAADVVTNTEAGSPGGGTGTDKADAASLMADAGGDDADSNVGPADWPEDWRAKLAGKDEKLAKRLSRFASPQNVLKSMLEAEKKLSSGQYKKFVPSDATPEEIAAYRKELGLPEKAEDYPLSFADGFVPGEDDKPILNDFKALALDSNIDPATASKVAQWALTRGAELRAAEEEATVQRDREIVAQAIDELRAEYGPEFRSNMAASKNFMHSLFGDELAETIMNARLPDGTKFGNNAEIVRRTVDFAKEMMPGADLMPGGTGDPAKGVDAEIADIEKKMNMDYNGYMADNQLQARYQQLLDARLRRQSRAA